MLPNWVGDVVLATPALRALRQSYPDAHIAYLLRPYVRDLVAATGWADELLYWPGRGSKHPQREQFELIALLRKRRFRLAIMMSNSFRSAMVAAAAGIPTRLGYNRDGRGFLLTDRLVAPRRDGQYLPVSMVRYYNALTAYLGCHPTSRLELVTDPKHEIDVDTRLVTDDPPGRGPRVVINPGAAFGSAKCWIPERFADVARSLIDRFDARVMIACGPSERHVAAEISRRIPHPHALLDDPVMGLGALMALIRRSDLLVTNDTGPRHFAVAFGVPVVTIFGSTDPRWTETGCAHETKISVPVECGPCMLRVCPIDHRCMNLVTSEMVTEASSDLLHARLPEMVAS